jgi:hypothetical protein
MEVLWHLRQFEVKNKNGKGVHYAGPMVNLIKKIYYLAQDLGFSLFRHTTGEFNFKKGGRRVRVVWTLRRNSPYIDYEESDEVDEWDERMLEMVVREDNTFSFPYEGSTVSSLMNEPEESPDHVSIYLYHQEGKTEDCIAYEKLSYLLEWLQDMKEGEAEPVATSLDTPKKRPRGFF